MRASESKKKAKRAALKAVHYARLATLRHALRQFLSFSRAAAGSEGLTTQQNQALLAIKAATEPVSIGDLAQSMFVHHHSAIGLVDRLERLRLIKRVAAADDRRKVELVLTPRGEEMIARLASAHWHELQHVGPQLRRALDEVLAK